MVANLTMVLAFSDVLDMVMHTGSTSTWTMKTGGSGGIWGQLKLLETLSQQTKKRRKYKYCVSKYLFATFSANYFLNKKWNCMQEYEIGSSDNGMQMRLESRCLGSLERKHGKGQTTEADVLLRSCGAHFRQQVNNYLCCPKGTALPGSTHDFVGFQSLLIQWRANCVVANRLWRWPDVIPGFYFTTAASTSAFSDSTQLCLSVVCALRKFIFWVPSVFTVRMNFVSERITISLPKKPQTWKVINEISRF